MFIIVMILFVCFFVFVCALKFLRLPVLGVWCKANIHSVGRVKIQANQVARSLSADNRVVE